ncbi:MAG TPA: hypothetical protein K8V11_03840 [Dietzia timorensis]|uniref:Uncharacterized protein n=1 Tax=Dietzia timorensis TaxID=499555 RepID=A0A921JXG6_9ACTN|nr:hypothetical protein [Dietzia timorensis]HJE90124.1 hypothetical protein [Dietzia timorensis]
MNKKLGIVAAFLILPLGAAAAAFAVSNEPGEPNVAVERVSQDLPRYDDPSQQVAPPEDDLDDDRDDDRDEVQHVQPQVPQPQLDDDDDVDDDWDDDDVDDIGDDWDDDDDDDDWDD